MSYKQHENAVIENPLVSLEAIPDGIFSVNYSLFKNNEKIASLVRKLFSLKLKGNITLGEKVYLAYTTGVFSGVFNLDSPSGETIAVAKRKGLLSGSYRIEYSNQMVLMKYKYFSLKTRYELYINEEMIGSIKLKKIFSRRLNFESNIEIPLEIMSFIMWLAILFITANNSSNNSNT